MTDSNNEKKLEKLFSELFRMHECRLYTLALRLTKSDQSAKDIIQEVFLKLWEQRDSLHSIKNKEAWLYRVTENKIIDFLRKSSADSRLRTAIWRRMQEIVNDSESLLSAKEYNEIIKKAIDQLPAQRKIIYRLNKEEGLGYQEIADEMNISKHTVKNQLFFAVQSVRQFLARSGKLFSILF